MIVHHGPRRTGQVRSGSANGQASEPCLREILLGTGAFLILAATGLYLVACLAS